MPNDSSLRARLALDWVEVHALLKIEVVDSVDKCSVCIIAVGGEAIGRKGNQLRAEGEQSGGRSALVVVSRAVNTPVCSVLEILTEGVNFCFVLPIL